MNIQKENNKALKAGFWYTICNFFTKGLAFITMPIFTRLMSTSDIGIFSNITSWFNVLAIITTFEIYSSVSIARFDYKKKLNEYISSSLVLGTIITAAFYILALIFHDVIEEFLIIDFETLNIIFIYLLVYPSIQMFQIKKQINYEYKSIIIVTLLSTILSSGISILLVLLLKNNPLMGRIYGYFIPLIVISFVVYLILLYQGKKISTKYWKYALAISFPLIWHLLAGYLLGAADKIMITKMISAEANALYSVSYTISTIASILWVSMNNAWSPWAYEKMDEKKYNELRVKSKPYTIFYTIIIFGLMLVTPELLLLMGGNDYVAAKYVMPPVMIGYLFQFVYSLYVNIEFYHKKQKNIAIGTIIASLINIVLNYLFLPIFGYIAAAYTTLIGYICLFIIHYLFVKKLKCDDWYDIKFFRNILLLGIILILIANILYMYTIIRYAIIFLIIVYFSIILVKNRKDIIKKLKNKKYLDIFLIFKKGL